MFKASRFLAQTDFITIMASSAIDRRRFQGPETSSPIRFVKPNGKGKQVEQAAVVSLLDADGSRQDDRKPQDTRPICAFMYSSKED